FFSVGNVTSYTHVCDTSNNTAPDSVCTYVVRAINSVGNGPSSNQATAPALVDHIAPVVVITAPLTGTFPSTNKPVISGTAGIAQGDATTVSVTIKQGATVVQGPFTATVSGLGTWSVPATAYTAGLPDGVYTVTAIQLDWGPNTGSAT